MRKYWLPLLVMSPLWAMTNIWPALIAAGAVLVGGLMSQKAQEEENEKKRKDDAINKSFDTQVEAQKTGLAGQQNAFSQLMDSYNKSLL